MIESGMRSQVGLVVDESRVLDGGPNFFDVINDCRVSL